MNPLDPTSPFNRGVMTQRAPIRDPAAAIRVLSILVGVMIAALVLFAVASELFVVGKIGIVHNSGLLTPGVGVAFVVCVAMASFLPRRFMERAGSEAEGKAREEVVGSVTSVFVSASILRAALLEAPALMGIVAAMTTGERLAYIATGLCIALLMATFPTRARLEAAIDRATGVRGV